jgi:hypothetical protein
VNVNVKRKDTTAWTGRGAGGRHQTLTITGQEVPKITAEETSVYLGLHIFLSLRWHNNAKCLTAKVLKRIEAIKTTRQDPNSLYGNHGDGG